MDPEAEANASGTLPSLCLTLRKRILAERGLELDAVMKELADEKAKADDLALDIDSPKASPPADAAGGSGGAGEGDGDATPAKKRAARSHGGRLNGVLRG